MKKRKDECLFCKSRSCYERVVAVGGELYDEIACSDHIKALHEHSDRAGSFLKNFISSSGKLSRGEGIDYTRIYGRKTTDEIWFSRSKTKEQSNGRKTN